MSGLNSSYSSDIIEMASITELKAYPTDRLQAGQNVFVHQIGLFYYDFNVLQLAATDYLSNHVGAWRFNPNITFDYRTTGNISDLYNRVIQGGSALSAPITVATGWALDLTQPLTVYDYTVVGYNMVAISGRITATSSNAPGTPIGTFPVIVGGLDYAPLLPFSIPVVIYSGTEPTLTQIGVDLAITNPEDSPANSIITLQSATVASGHTVSFVQTYYIPVGIGLTVGP